VRTIIFCPQYSHGGKKGLFPVEGVDKAQFWIQQIISLVKYHLS